MITLPKRLAKSIKDKSNIANTNVANTFDLSLIDLASVLGNYIITIDSCTYVNEYETANTHRVLGPTKMPMRD